MPLVFPNAPTIHLGARPRLLLCSSPGDSDSIQRVLAEGEYSVESMLVSRPIAGSLRALLSEIDVVLIDVTAQGRDIVETIGALDAAIGLRGIRPRILCFATAHRSPRFVTDLQKRGARYVRIDGAGTLLEEVDRHIFEMNELERNGPVFEIVHRFSQGCCAPGEEIAGAFLIHDTNRFQLPLGLAQRLVLDFLAKHRQIALDSFQIASGLSGDHFYCEHGANSGQRQCKKIRRATVKVLVGRIRQALASAFVEANLQFDPTDVLRSCPAEGSKRVLYKLCARVVWHHTSE